MFIFQIMYIVSVILSAIGFVLISKYENWETLKIGEIILLIIITIVPIINSAFCIAIILWAIEESEVVSNFLNKDIKVK